MDKTPKTDAARGKGRFSNCVDADFAGKLEAEHGRLIKALRGFITTCEVHVELKDVFDLRVDVAEARGVLREIGEVKP